MKIQVRMGLVIAVGVVAAAAIATRAARAGYKAEYGITCEFWDDDRGRCSGSMGSIRADSSNKSYLSIAVEGRYPPAGTVGWAYVFMRDAAGNTRQCRIGGASEGLIEAARSATADSWVSVTWNGIGDCTELSVERGSHMRPTTL